MSIAIKLRHRAGTIARLAKPSLIPAFIAAAVVFTGGYFYEKQNRENFRSELKINVQNELNLIATRLQGDIEADITALKGFANSVSVDPQMSQETFDLLAAKLLIQNPQMLRVSVAPDAVIGMTYPLAGNERMIGTDLKRFGSSRVAADRAQYKAKPIIAGPVRLPSGRSGFNLFSPIFVRYDRHISFWGFMESVIDEKQLYRDARLLPDTSLDPDQDDDTRSERHRKIDIKLSIRDVSVADNVQDPFFGDPEVFDSSPVIRTLSLPGGTWELAAIPSAGWAQEPSNGTGLEIAILVAAAVVIIPIFLTGGLVNERQRNIAKLRARENELLAMSYRLDLALEASEIGIWEIDLKTRKLSWDNRMYHLHGMPEGDGMPSFEAWRGVVHPLDVPDATTGIFTALNTGMQYRTQYRILRTNGSVSHVRSIGSSHIDADGHAKLTGITWDVTDDVVLTDALRSAKAMAEAKNSELAEAKDRIEHNALHDPLTGLGNRRMLDKKLELLSASAKDGLLDVAILHIDLDRFKQINDTLGHAAGDAMLVHASEILRSSVRKGDIVARIGGDEFVVVVANPPGGNFLAALSERIIAQMRRPVDYNGFPCRFGVSIGIAVAKDQAVNERKLLVNADIALYRAKENGRNRYEFFTETLQAEIITAKRIADEILEGIEKNQFVAWYQPQFEAGTLRLAGVEALIRWNHPRHGLLTPDKFLGIAEDLNVVAILDRIVLDRSLLDALRWAAAGIHVPKISVNVSAKRLSDDSLLQSLQGLSFKQGQLSFELVESIFLDESDDIVTANIEGIKKLGIDIEIDDFGTGHTSIVSLLKIKPKRLKIDRQLVAPILQARSEQALVRSIIEIGRSLNIETVAEGVETMAHAEMLGLFGCDMLQGYAFAKPLSCEDFIRFASTEALALAS